MKLGTFIVAALCAATPVYADHLAVIQRYQRAYGEQPDPHLLTMIANEYRDAGRTHEAVAYYCSYIFTSPAGDDADYASQQVHLLKPGMEKSQLFILDGVSIVQSGYTVRKAEVASVDTVPDTVTLPVNSPWNFLNKKKN